MSNKAGAWETPPGEFAQTRASDFLLVFKFAAALGLHKVESQNFAGTSNICSTARRHGADARDAIHQQPPH